MNNSPLHSQSEALLSSDRPEAFYLRFWRSPRFAPILLFVVLAWQFASLIFEAGNHPFWYDEVLTLDVSGLQPFSTFWAALKAGADGMPLGFYLFVRAARLLPFTPEISLRLPSILGYLLSLVGVYLFARKRMPAVAGLAGVLLLVLSPLREYALEARGYSLLVGLLAMAAVCWQEVDEKPFRKVLLALLLAMASSCHPLAALSLSIFGVAELAWSFQFRRIRWGVWVAYVIGGVPFVLDLPILMHYKVLFGKNFWARPNWNSISSSYGSYLGLEPNISTILVVLSGIVLVGALLRKWRTRESISTDGNGFGFSELTLICGFLFYPVLLVTLTVVMHSGYVARYAWPTIIGLALAFVYLLKSAWLEEPLAQAIVLSLLIGVGLRDYRTIRHEHSAGSDQLWTQLTQLSRSQPGLPVLIGSGNIYLEAVRYCPPDVQGRLVEVSDAEISARLIGMDTTDRTNRILAQYVHLHLEDAASFEASNPKFIFLSGGKGDWMSLYLMQKKYNLTLFLNDSRLISAHDDTNIYIAQQ